MPTLPHSIPLIAALAVGLTCLFGCGEDAPAGPDAGTAAGACPRRFLEQDVTNARDLGGHPLGAGFRVACGKVLRGGDLSVLSSGGCQELAKRGIRTVIDLRMASTQASSPAAACVSAQARVVSAAMPKLLPDTPENYLALMKEKTAIAAVFAALGDPAAYPAYVHCVIGRDRASFVAALVLGALGASRATIVDEFKLSAQAGVAVRPACIEAVLDSVQQQGGFDAYLRSVGVTRAQLDVLRQQAREST